MRTSGAAGADKSGRDRLHVTLRDRIAARLIAAKALCPQ